ncbi:hypothetical protein C1H76_3350 [Elsinoe australis]|uniref:Uncharacterized protein n=1 Tax=Elsinoe australis TaxID=40998 RepID=A0A4U7B080_9PEZI|nr:hypothetical protein C1H76_3350 [Elsinoe australis]
MHINYQFLAFALLASSVAATPVRTPSPPAKPPTPMPESEKPDKLYRNTGQSPGQIEDAGGASSWARTTGQTPKYDVQDHADPPTSDGKNEKNDGLVSFSRSQDVAKEWNPNGNVIQVDPKDKQTQVIDVNKKFPDNPYAHEDEFAVKDHAPAPTIDNIQQMKDGNVDKTRTYNQPPSR